MNLKSKGAGKPSKFLFKGCLWIGGLVIVLGSVGFVALVLILDGGKDTGKENQKRAQAAITLKNIVEQYYEKNNKY